MQSQHKKAMPNTTLEQIQTSTTTEMQLCMQNIQYKTNTLVKNMNNKDSANGLRNSGLTHSVQNKPRSRMMTF